MLKNVWLILLSEKPLNDFSNMPYHTLSKTTIFLLRNHYIVSLAIYFLFSISGCGYNLGQGVGNAQGVTLYVNVPMFQNKTNEPNLGSLVTYELKNTLLNTPGIKLVNDAHTADIVIKGQIIRYRVPTTAFDQRASTEEDVELYIAIQAKDMIKNKLLWRNTINTSAAFYLGPDLTMNRSAQDRATEEASKAFSDIVIGHLLDHTERKRRQDEKRNKNK